MRHQPSEETERHWRKPHHFIPSKEVVAICIMERRVNVRRVPSEVLDRFRHECGPHPVLHGELPGHELEERLAVGGTQRMVIFPIDLKLSVTVLQNKVKVINQLMITRPVLTVTVAVTVSAPRVLVGIVTVTVTVTGAIKATRSLPRDQLGMACNRATPCSPLARRQSPRSASTWPPHSTV